MAHKERTWLLFLYCLAVAGLCLLVCSKSSPLYPINDWTDANAYFSCGKGMLAGRVIYRDLYEHKGPLLYALHALCCLMDGTSFLGVYLLETLSFALFLLAAYRTLRLYGAGRAAYAALPVIAFVVLTAVSFQQGDSAEELSLPLLAWPVYLLLRWRRQGAPERMDAGVLLLCGALFGCALWIKFTLVGLFVPWLAALVLTHAARREWRAAFACVGWFALGALLSTLPWLAYFGINGALGDWLKTYLYDNLFLYGDGALLSLAGRVKAMLRGGWDWLWLNPLCGAALLLGLGAFSLAARRWARALPGGVTRWERRMGWLLMGFTALGVFVGGKTYLYYGFALAALMPLAFVPLFAWLGNAHMLKPQAAGALLAALTLAAGGACALVTPNRGDLLKPRGETMQYRFAAIIRQTPSPTLLNYGFMDAGFYTAACITPTVKYFHQTNVQLEEMYAEQARYIAEGVTDYVVTRGRQPADIAEKYDLVAVQDATEGFWYRQVFLYRRKGLAP